SIDQRHLHDVEVLRGRAHKRTAVADVNVNIRALVQMLRIVRVALTHDGSGDDGVDFDSGHARAAVSYGPQHVDAASGPNVGEVSVGAQNVGQRRRSGHEIVFPHRALPVREVRVHDVSGSVGVDDDGFGLALAVDLDA